MIAFPDVNDLMTMNENEYRDHMLLDTLEEMVGFHDDDNDDEKRDGNMKQSSNVEAQECVSTAERQEGMGSKKDCEGNGSTNSIITPTQYDILCGQSRTCANHYGNQRFQTLLEEYATRYCSIQSKQQKMNLTKEIVHRIRHGVGGRFLKYHKATGSWKEISDVMARDKISHALRTKVATWKRKQKQAQIQANLLLADETSSSDSSFTGERRRPRRRRKSAPAIASSQRLLTSNAETASTPTSEPTRSVSLFNPSSSSSSSETDSNFSSPVMSQLLKNQKEILASLLMNDNRNSSR